MLLLTSSILYAQQGTDWKTQGNTADSTAFIGTTNASSLILRSNDLERMRISENGNVGIGVDNPQTALDVEGDIQLTGDIIFKGYEDLQNPVNRFLMIDKTGKSTSVKMKELNTFMSWEDCYDIQDQITFNGETGTTTIVAGTYASWAPRIQGTKSILYTGSECSAWVGIGTELPMTKLDVRGAGRFTKGVKVGEEYIEKSGLYIENYIYSNGSNTTYFDHLIMVKDESGEKLLQLNNDGLLRAREIKVDLDTWPDYVFEKDYKLMPLNELRSFLLKYKHLPNVPSANEIERDGVNLGEAAKTSMEKIEELTLYLLEINDKVEKQEVVLNEQQKLLEQQQETIRLQQELILELKNLTNKN
ncbi:hypothetical protein [Brumimicrobium oceani]|uniref:Peptidase S74 domain-containing protein n=1 Tax=Brumimicrobium oceani TaxID=2100725 RepID=A0A2U2XAH0_9FLAO|nr:hypothetical protein [Brumimicrobium oceani]PWH84763.1 hypothetical protein DIT68_12595 [Brumimicrobium oceani]